jgi:hypothetical protein
MASITRPAVGESNDERLRSTTETNIVTKNEKKTAYANILFTIRPTFRGYIGGRSGTGCTGLDSSPLVSVMIFHRLCCKQCDGRE